MSEFLTKKYLQMISCEKIMNNNKELLSSAGSSTETTVPEFLTTRDTVTFYYISDIHIDHRLLREGISPSRYTAFARKYGRDLVCDSVLDELGTHKKVVILFLGDITSCLEIAEAFYSGFMEELKSRRDERLKSQLMANLKLNYEKLDILKTFDDKNWRTWKNHFYGVLKKKDAVKARDHEINRLREQMDYVEHILSEPIITTTMPNVLVISILGNHELWGFKTLMECMEIHKTGQFGLQTYAKKEDCEIAYKKMFERIGIKFLNNNAVQIGDIIILGGTGYAGQNPNFNASSGLYRGVINVPQEIAETEAFEITYQNALKLVEHRRGVTQNGTTPLAKSSVLVVVTHNPIEDWKSDKTADSGVVYFNGHTHINKAEIDGDRDIHVFANNQVGYKTRTISLAKVSVYERSNPFAKYADGFHKITTADYNQFLLYIGEYCKLKNIEKHINIYNKTFYMVKHEGYYGFFLINENGCWICNKGQIRKANKETDISYFDKNFLYVVNSYKSAMAPYRKAQQDMAAYVKSFGGDGTIHGSIVDVDFFSHIMLNPLDGSITYYYSPIIGEIWKYDRLQDLLDVHCKELAPIHKRVLEQVQKGQNHNNLLLIDRDKNQTSIGTGLFHKVDVANSPYAISIRINKFHSLFDGRNVLRDWTDANIVPSTSMQDNSHQLPVFSQPVSDGEG